jgi:hypothetical protein
MAFAQSFIFRAVLHTRLGVKSAEFCFMMQIAMWAGYKSARILGKYWRLSNASATVVSNSAMMRPELSAVSAIWLRFLTEKSFSSPNLMRW